MRPFLAGLPAQRANLPLLGILALALGLRTWGLTWGLPSATHYFSYHPDESVVLGTASSMSVFGGRLLPHFYNYGSLQLYLVCFANTLAALFGFVDIVPKALPAWYPEWARMYLIGRWLTVLMGVGTAWAVYALGLRLWGRRAGLFAALTLAIIPLHAQHSHFLTVDVPGTFWVMLSLLWAVRLATDDPIPLRAALVAGLCAGLAAATKYNLALAILPVLAACVMRPTPGASADPSLLGKGEEKKRNRLYSDPSLTGKGGEFSSRVRFLLAALAASILAFLAACPGAVLENGTFLDNVRYEAVHVQNPDDPTFRDTGSGFVYHITHNLDAGLGLPLLVLALVSVGYALYRRERGDGLLAAFALPYYILISLAAVRYARYTIPLLPILALWVGRMLADGSRETAKIAPGFVKVTGGGVLLVTLALAFLLIQPMAGIDPRDKAMHTLFAFVPPRSVGFPVQPWFGTVPISPYFSSPRPGAWKATTLPKQLQRIIYTGKDWDVQSLETQKPEFVVLSEYDYDDALRLKDPAAKAYLATLTLDYRRLWVNEDTPSFASRGLPHDMTYTNPIIYIYGRN